MLDLFTQMFANGTVTEKQKRRVIVCIPKVTRRCQLTDYRPITLLNTDYEIMARIMAGRIDLY